MKHHVPITLELAHPNYNKWAAFFTSLCGKFYLGSHVDGSLAPAPTDASWVAADCDVRGWIYRSVADDVLDLAMAPEQTARDLWVAIADLFQANKVPRAVFLAEQFHSMTQGDLSIDQFYQRMKQTADSLRDVGHTILASQLVLNLLRGLNRRYSSTADDIVNKDVLPSFAAAHNMLVLKELRLANESKVQTGAALLAGPPSSSTCTNASCRSSNSGSPAAPPQQHAGNSGSGGGGSGGGRHGNSQQQQQAGGHRQQAAQPAGPWFCFSPAAF